MAHASVARAHGRKFWLLALLAVATVVMSSVRADDAAPPASSENEILKNMKAGAGQQLGGTPVEMIWKDVYPFIVHRGLGGLIRSIYEALMIRMYYQEAMGVADVVMTELEFYLFGNAGSNRKSWQEIRALYGKYMREFFDSSPEVPFSALQSGVWKTLLRLYTEKLQDLFSGTPKNKLMTDLLFDNDLVVIKSWTDAQHVAAMKLKSPAARREAVQKLRETRSGRVKASYD